MIRIIQSTKKAKVVYCKYKQVGLCIMQSLGKTSGSLYLHYNVILDHCLEFYLISRTLSLLKFELLNNWRLSDVEIQGWNWARLLEQRVPKMTQIFAWGSSMKIIKVIIMTIIVSWLAFKNLLAWICYIF